MSRLCNLTHAAAVAAALAAAGAVGLAGVAAVPAFATVSPLPPHIVATPNNVMVNTTTHLTGTGFEPNSTLTVKECSKTEWIVPQDPCATANVVHVRTNGAGRFEHTLTALLCPASSPAVTPPGFAEVCYVGVPTPRGIDQVVLLGAAQITVTGP